jgi:hypothetical protein
MKLRVIEGGGSMAAGEFTDVTFLRETAGKEKARGLSSVMAGVAE